MPTIAAVIPLYNGAAYIGAALTSVFAQTHAPDEIIVVDDGSTDGGAAMVAELAATRPITLLRKPNGGQSSARNAGVAAARSELIAFLDQDDIWYPQHIALLLRPFDDDPALGWSYSDLDEIDASGTVTLRAVHTQWHGPHPKPDAVACLRENMQILPTAALVRRAAILSVEGFDERLSGYEDDDLFLRLLQAGYAHRYVPQPTGQWRKHAASSFHSWRMGRSCLIYMNKLLERFPEHRTMIAARFTPVLRKHVFEAIRSGDRDARRQTLAAARHCLGLLPWQQRPQATLALLARMARGIAGRSARAIR